jgi:hypothetical protein
VDAGPEQRLYSLGKHHSLCANLWHKAHGLERHRHAELPLQIVSWVAQTTSYACERPAHKGKRQTDL